MAVYEKVCCIHCGNNDVRKFGKRGDKQRYHCHQGCGKTFQGDYRYEARRPGVKERIIDIAMNGGILIKDKINCFIERKDDFIITGHGFWGFAR